MKTVEQSLEEIFEAPLIKQSMPALVEDKALPVAVDSSLDLKGDLADAYQQTKDNLQDIIDQGKEAMEDILEIARAGQDRRAFEVFGGILKNVVDANKELLAIQKQMRDMDNSTKKGGGGGTTIDKAVFVGTPAELNKLLRGEDIGPKT